jgi:hypothetical protein
VLGWAITTVARTLADLAGVPTEHALERAVHEAQVLRLLDAPSVLAAGAGRPGAPVLRTILATPDPGVTRSELEEAFLALVRIAGLPPPRLDAHVAAGQRLISSSSSTAALRTTPGARSTPTVAATPRSLRAVSR